MKPLKILVVDDSAFMRKLITEMLQEDTRLQVIGTARNGKEAIDKVIQYKPDAVTMDVEMPIMNGIDAVKYIMENDPVPVIMLSSTTKSGAENTIAAMANGAFDFIAKPSGPISLDLKKVQDDLINKILAASKSKRMLTSQDKNFGQVIQPATVRKSIRSNEPKMVLIGTSTGGPRALQEVLTKLPAALQAPVLIVQHMPPGFTQSLANRLNSLCAIHVKEAENKEILQKGTAYIAPGGYHMRVVSNGSALHIQLGKEPPEGGHRPSVNVLFKSAAEIKGYQKVAVILTGMGSDGTEGLLCLKDEGEVTAIAESEDSCIVYGMPKAAFLTKKIDEVSHLSSVAARILNYL